MPINIPGSPSEDEAKLPQDPPTAKSKEQLKRELDEKITNDLPEMALWAQTLQYLAQHVIHNQLLSAEHQDIVRHLEHSMQEVVDAFHQLQHGRHDVDHDELKHVWDALLHSLLALALYLGTAAQILKEAARKRFKLLLVVAAGYGALSLLSGLIFYLGILGVSIHKDVFLPTFNKLVPMIRL
ncbi:uncharacterized protein EHS24_002926 [Apiotrichum porosum]|uniref:Uncharacterized protein n=1 Tax=Apiotrichum porosum TaxID=105984 RepID=A0A427XG36_9TREE|nr:uncharacterized protein EHS24_002926 [Apiotrichum porosum]RSH77860.1 hypothetical protein EHS24_002926 [Apiotrichum porosum]